MTIARHDEGTLVRVRLDRPAKLNALDDSIRDGLDEILSELEDRPDVRVLLIEGAGRAFSAGADLSSGGADPSASWADRRHVAGAWQRVLDRLGRVPQATVARLHGHVIGGAVLLAAACDIRIASHDTVVQIPELAIGIPLTWAGVPLLVREVGLPITRDWVMSGRPVMIDELVRTGFAQRSASLDSLDDAVDDCVSELLAMPPGPLAMTRAMTAAIGRQHPSMVAAWADPDLLAWSFREPEGRAAAKARRDRRR